MEGMRSELARRQAGTDKNAPPTIADGIGLLFIRLFLGAVAVVVLLGAAMLIGFFSGGSISGLILLDWIGIIVTPIWAFAPLCRAIAGREKHGKLSEASRRQQDQD